MRFLKLFLVILAVSLTFNNCSNISEPIAEEKFFSVQCTENCENLTEYKIENDLDENIDVRQSVESYLSILGMKLSSLSTENLTSINAEKKRRLALLAQEPDLTKLNTINMLSQASLAGEVCRTFVTTNGLNSPLFAAITFSQKPNQIPLNNWLSTVQSFAFQAWGRSLTEAESFAFNEFIKTSLSEATRSPNADKISDTNSLETINLGIMICTVVLASPEASSL